MNITFWVEDLEYILVMSSWSHAAIKLLLQNSILLSDRIEQLPPTLGSMAVRYACTMCWTDFSFNGIAKTNNICKHIAVSA